MFRTLLVTKPEPVPLVARLVLGAVMFPHGAQHALGWFGGYGFHGTLQWMTGTLGFPAVLAAPAILIELIAPVALILGLGGRLAGLGIAGLMAGAASTHYANGFFMNWFGSLPAGSEGYEYHILAGTLAVVVVIAGSGAWSLDRWITSPACSAGEPSRSSPPLQEPRLEPASQPIRARAAPAARDRAPA